jgi:cytochrome c peroxidase
MQHILDEYISDKDMAIALGKAFFWDQAAGSDGQACASCHFSAGADNRSKNQLSPGFENRIAGIDPTLFNSTITGGVGPNHQFTKFDFPFPKTGIDGTFFDDVAGSQGTSAKTLVSIQADKDTDICESLPNDFSLAGLNHRQVTGRNAPTVINAVFNHRNFWDGRANNMFNGVDPLGRRSNLNNPDQGIWIYDSQTKRLSKKQVLIKNSSLASQATGPALSSIEMSCEGRTFPLLGRKMLSRRGLSHQAVATDDSVLGTFRHASGQGISQTYAEMVRLAFNSKYWGAPTEAESGFTQMESNFSLFWGLAIQMYEATLVSDMSPFDQFARGDNSALTEQEKLGLEVFVLKDRGNCVACHGGTEFTSATVRARALSPDGGEMDAGLGVVIPGETIERMLMSDGDFSVYDGGFYNIGVTQSDMDKCVGADLAGFPLSFSAQAVTENHVDFESSVDVSMDVVGDPSVPVGPAQPDERIAVDGACKTPTLRNVELTAPYFHNGSHATLEQVVISYMAAFKHLFADENIDNLAPEIPNVRIMGNEIDALTAFMNTLTDERVRLHQAPFDHPELVIPSGSNGVDANNDNIADDEFITVSAVGRGGLVAPLSEFMEPFVMVAAVAATTDNPVSTTPAAATPALATDTPAVTATPVDVVASTGGGVFDISGTANPGETVIVTNKNGDPIGTAVADAQGDWNITQSLDNKLYPKEGDTLTATTSSGSTTNFTFERAGPAADIVGSGLLVVTDFGTTPGTFIPPPAPVIDPIFGPIANFIGAAQDLLAGGATVADFQNASRAGRARLDIIIANVPRPLFVNTGDAFGDTGTGLGEQVPPNPPNTIGAGDEVGVDRFSAIFKDASGNVIRTFAQDNVQIVAQEILAADGVTVTGARQDVVWLLWSIRFGDVATLAGATTVEIWLDVGTQIIGAAVSVADGAALLASANVAGDFVGNFAQNVAFTNPLNIFPDAPLPPALQALVDAVPAVPGVPVVPVVPAPAPAPAPALAVVQASISGLVEAITLDNPADRFSAGTITVGNRTVIIPANLVSDEVANRLTLQEIVTQGNAVDSLVTDLSVGILANRLADGRVIAGELFVHKTSGLPGEGATATSIHGEVTDINGDGSFTIGDAGTGLTVIRLNDPETRHTIQSCSWGPSTVHPNCSADPRFTNDPDNYTFVATTGYPMCVTGNGALCDTLGRGPGQSAVIDDSTRFAAIQIGDNVFADGNFETIGLDTFFSAHTIIVNAALTTAPGNPDFMIFDEVEWDCCGYQNERTRGLLIGFTTLSGPDSNVEVYAMHNSTDGEPNEVLIASTIGCDTIKPFLCTLQGTPPTTNGVFKLRMDVDFIEAALRLATGKTAVVPKFSPCAQLGGLTIADYELLGVDPETVPCNTVTRDPDTILANGTVVRGAVTDIFTDLFDVGKEFAVMNPLFRDLVGRTRNKVKIDAQNQLNAAAGVGPIIEVLDVTGTSVPWGQYINPVGQGHPEFGEIDLARIHTPFIFTGQPWLLDRRLGPAGSDTTDDLTATAVKPLTPFPCSGLDPRTQVVVPTNLVGGQPAADEIFDVFNGTTDSGFGATLLPVTLTPPGCDMN